MDGNFIVAGLNVLIAFIGVLVVILAIIEYRRLVKIKEDLESTKKEFKEEIFKTQKASQRVMTSYSVGDIQQKIKLLLSAVEICPGVFNGYNALGYAYLEAGSTQRALDAFKEATIHRPADKEGYFDLARAHLNLGDQELAIKYLIQAIRVDPSSKDDIRDDPFFEPVMSNKELCRVISSS
jgi:tetratricopeptide (TPR) repeat protein